MTDPELQAFRERLAAYEQSNRELWEQREALRARVAALEAAARPFVAPGSSNPMDPAVIALEKLLAAPELQP